MRMASLNVREAFCNSLLRSSYHYCHSSSLDPGIGKDSGSDHISIWLCCFRSSATKSSLFWSLMLGPKEALPFALLAQLYLSLASVSRGDWDSAGLQRFSNTQSHRHGQVWLILSPVQNYIQWFPSICSVKCKFLCELGQIVFLWFNSLQHLKSCQ
jgi:hypothetical protein